MTSDHSADVGEAVSTVDPIRPLLYPVDVPTQPPTDLQSARALQLIGPKTQLRIIMSERVWNVVQPHYERIDAANRSGERRAKRHAWREFYKAVERLIRTLEREAAQPATDAAQADAAN